MTREELTKDITRKITAINNLLKIRIDRTIGIEAAKRYLISKGKL